MPGVDPVLALPLKLNPNITLTYKPNCMDTIATGVRQLLMDANDKFPLANINLRVAYLFLASNNPQSENPQYPDNHLSLSVSMSDADLADRLVVLLNEHFQKDNRVDGLEPVYCDRDILSKNDRPKNVRNKKNPMSACVVIRHAYVPRFLNEICRAVSLYARDQYSLVRDFYLVGPEGGRMTIANDDVVRVCLREKYQALHRAYDLSEKMQSRSVSLAHYANGANAGASLFKKVHHSANTEEELYQRLNALVHAYHYQLGDVGTKVQDFVDKMTPGNDRTRIVNTYGDNFLTIIQHGEMLYEISRCFKENPEVRLAFVSPDNLFRAGSAALVGGRGTVEEMMVRVTNYVPAILKQAQLDPSDPQGMLCAFYSHLSPTGNTLVLGKASGAFHLEGLKIPEYISHKDVKAYSEFAYNALHLAREMEHADGYQDNYPAYREAQPRFVPGVQMLDAQGVVRSVGVMGMVGIDGRPRRPGSFAEKVGFADSDLQDKKGFNERHEFDFDKTREFYETQWIAAFDEILKPGNRVDVFVLNPVGCGAFDPSPDGSTFTQASAQGFAAALVAKRAELEAANVKLVLPIYDMRKVYSYYYNEINYVFNVVPAHQCMGGSVEFCHAAIVEKYRELGGDKFDIEHKTLSEIIAHALQKDRKTREALMALNYLQVGADGSPQLHTLAPRVIGEAFAEVRSDLSPLRIKERIIEAYKNVRGKFFYKRSEARREAFDIFSASLQSIFEHAEMKEGHTRRALQNLRYIKPELVDGHLVLCDGEHPESITQAFEAMEQARQQRAPMHP